MMPPIDQEWTTSFERMGAMLQGQKVDQILGNPILIGHAAYIHNRTLYDFYTKPALGVELMLNASQSYGTMPNLQWFYAVYWCEDFGGKIRFPTGRMSAPAIEEYPYKTPEEAEKYEVLDADELRKRLTWKRHEEALEAQKKLLGPLFSPYQFVYEMFIRVSYLVSPEKALLLSHKNPELIHKLLKKVVEQSIIQNKMVADQYGSVFILTSSLLANSSTMSPQQCREFNIKYCKEMVEKSMKAASCTGVSYHLCGDHGKDWPLHEDVPTPPGTIMHVAYDGLKSADLTKVAKVFGNRCALLGNLDTAMMMRGTPAQVYEQTKKDVLAYKNFQKGFIAGTACECPPFAPPANVMAFMRAVNEYGKVEG